MPEGGPFARLGRCFSPETGEGEDYLSEADAKATIGGGAGGWAEFLRLIIKRRPAVFEAQPGPVVLAAHKSSGKDWRRRLANFSLL